MSEEQSSHLRKGCMLGCGALVFLGLLVFGAGAAFMLPMFGDFDDAEERRAEIVERYGDRDDYVPAADGAIPAERIEAYLAVRQQLAPHCVGFEETLGRIADVADKADGEEPTTREALGLLKPAFRLGPLFGEYYITRNEALLEAEMGFGEYTYLHVLAVHAGRESPEDVGLRDGRLKRASRRSFRRMLVALAEREETTAELRAEIEAEIEKLEAERRRAPFQDGLPAALEAPLAPHREQFDALRCSWAEPFALAQPERRGPGIHIKTN